ncbi:MAG TPA: hypothetical protein VNX17_07905 [Edaphobacter sp.]|nr:hypothetical protein [Edaphobacter sp.]
MKQIALCVALGLLTITPPLMAQARDIPSAGLSHPADQTQEQRGRKLLDQMLEALGGDAWINRRNLRVVGHLGRFFQGTPNGIVVDFTATRQFASGDRPDAQRIGFLTDKSMILPGKKIDVVQIWINNTGHEVTYKGNITLPKDQIEDYYRRQDHSIESIYRVWLKAPGVVVIDEGSTMVERRLTERVTILSDNNDAVTLDIDAQTHLPRRRTFVWRNTTFKDKDEDAEEYDDYHTIQGLPTAFTISRYHNGDLVSQTFYTKVEYDVDLSPDTFNPDILLKKKQ